MRIFQLMLAASAFSLSAAAAAQETSAPQDEQSDGSLMADIIVTAQKKSVGENAQDVPIAITALGGAQLDTLNVRSLADLSSVAPNVGLDENNNVRGYANFAIRGASLNSSVPTLEPSVGLFVDGIYQGVSAGAVSNNFDLASIQILRGPQGTLFGRNVTGGAVLVETARPENAFGGFIQASYETGPEYGVEGAVNIPLGTTLSTRLAGYYRKDKGWFHNDFNNTKVGASETFIARPSFLFESGALKQTLILEYGEVNGDGSPLQPRFDVGGPRPFKINIDDEGQVDRRWYSATSETVIDVGFGDGAITNSFGYRNFRDSSRNDIDATPQPLFHFGFLVDQYQISNELRYAGRFGPADITAGVYYLHQELEYRESRAPFIGGDRGGGGYQMHDGYGVFGQISFDISDQLNVTGGLRYSSEKKAATIVRLTPGFCTNVALPCDFRTSPTVDGSRSWNSLSPKVGLNYKINSDVLVYASFGKAVRSGGYNIRLSSPLDPGVFDQEDLTAYEVGMKADFLDRKLRVNIAAFRNDYKDLQRTVATFVGSSIIQTIDNSADARIQGLELDLTLEPDPSLQFLFNVGYLDAKYTDIRADLSGDNVVTDADYALRLSRIPKFSVSAGAVHTLKFGSGASLRSGIFYSHRGDMAASDNNIAIFDPSEDLRADITFTLPNRSTSISAFGRNLTNDPNAAGGINVANLPGGGGQGIREGRTFGIELRQTF